MKRGVFLIVLLSLFKGLLSQPPANFLRTIGGVGEDIGYSCKVTFDGGYIVAGSTTSFNDNNDFYLIKVDSMGNDRWQKHFGGSGNEVANSVIQLPDSGFMMAGYTSSFGAGGYDIWVVRTDKVGEKLWEKTYGGVDWDFGQDLVLGTDGFIYVIGFTDSFGSGKRDGVIYKIDLAGTVSLTKTFGGSEDDELSSIIKLNDGALGVVGTTSSFGDLNGDIYFLKLNNGLDTVFTRKIGGALKDSGKDLTQNSINNEIYLCGAKTYSNYPKTRSYMYRMTDVGMFKSDSNYYRATIDESFISVCTSKNHYYGLPVTAFARTAYFPINKYQAEVFLALPAGNSYLINESGGTEEEFVYSIEATKDGGFIYVGSTNGFGARGKDIYMVKQDSNIINYESIVSIQEVKEKSSSDRIQINQQKIVLTDDELFMVERIEIYDLKGMLIKEFSGAEKLKDAEVVEIIDKLFFIRIYYKDGHSITRKVLLE